MPQSRNKYYLRAPHTWTQLSPRVQAMLVPGRKIGRTIGRTIGWTIVISLAG